MTPLQTRLSVVYAFLAIVAAFSIEGILSLLTNPLSSYLDRVLWFYVALDMAAIVVAVMTVLTLRRRATTGPRLVIFIACATLIAYLGSKIILIFLMKNIPFYRIVGIKPFVISLFAVFAIITVRTKAFVNGYSNRL